MRVRRDTNVSTFLTAEFFRADRGRLLVEFRKILSQPLAETRREFERPSISNQVHNVPGSIHQSFAVMAFLEMLFEASPKVRL